MDTVLSATLKIKDEGSETLANLAKKAAELPTEMSKAIADTEKMLANMNKDIDVAVNLNTASLDTLNNINDMYSFTVNGVAVLNDEEAQAVLDGLRNEDLDVSGTVKLEADAAKTVVGGLSDDLNTLSSTADVALDNLYAAMDGISGKYDEISTTITTAKEFMASMELDGPDTESLNRYIGVLDGQKDDISRILGETQQSIEDFNQFVQSGSTDPVEWNAQIDGLNTGAAVIGDMRIDANSYMGQAQTTIDMIKSSAEEAKRPVQELAGEFEELGSGSAPAVENMAALSGSFSEMFGILAQMGLVGGIAGVMGKIDEQVKEFSEAKSTLTKITGTPGEEFVEVYDNVLARSPVKDTNVVAGVIGQTNTLFGYMGDDLEDLSVKVIDFARATDTEAVGAVKNLSDTVKAFGYSNDDVNGIQEAMDLVTKAGQVSGIAPSKLFDDLKAYGAPLRELNYDLVDSIELISQLDYAGVADNILQGLRQFAQDGGTREDLDAFIEDIKNAGDDAGALAGELFKSAGPAMADAAQRDLFDTSEWSKNFEDIAGLTEKTAEGATTVEDAWTSAFNTIQAGFNENFAPMLESGQEMVAGIVEGTGEFMREYPVVTKVVGALVVGLGTATLAVTGYTLATKLAAAATTAFGTAAGTIFWPVAIISGAIAGVTMLTEEMRAAAQEYREMSPVTRTLKDDLDALNKEYNALSDKSTPEALRMEDDIATLEYRIKAEGTKMADILDSAYDVVTRRDEIFNAYNTGIAKAEEDFIYFDGLVGRIGELMEADPTGNKTRIQVLLDELNAAKPELNATLDDIYGDTEDWASKTRALLESGWLSDQEGLEYAQYSGLSRLFGDAEMEMSKLEEHLAVAESNLKQRTFDAIVGESQGIYTHDMTPDELFGDPSYGINWVEEAKERFNGDVDLEAYEELRNAYEDLQGVLDDTSALDVVIDRMGGLEEAQKAVTAGMTDYEDVAKAAMESVMPDLEALAQKYDQAFESARGTLDAQMDVNVAFSLPEVEMPDLSTQTENIRTYTEAYSEYGDNLALLKESGLLDQPALETLATGTPEAMAQAAELAADIAEGANGAAESINGTVTAFNEAMSEYETARDATAGVMAAINTNFDEELTAIVERAVTFATEFSETLDMSNEVTRSANTTVVTLINRLRSGIDGARKAGQDTVTAYLDKIKELANITINAPTVKVSGVGSSSYAPIPGGITGAASGTLNAPDVFFAGEEGPELIIGKSGSTVFPTGETDRIIDAVSNRYSNVIPFPAKNTERESSSEGGKPSGEGTQRAVLDININGQLTASGSTMGEVWPQIQAKVYDEVAKRLEAEIAEQGDRRHVI